MAKEPDCDKPTESGDLYVVCVSAWARYRLTGVTRLNGTRLGETIALIRSSTPTQYLAVGGASCYSALMRLRRRSTVLAIRLFRRGARTELESGSDEL